MAPPRYAPLPNPRSTEEAEREMDDAFEDDSENTPLNVSYAAPSPTHGRTRSTPPGQYDFEHEFEYDFPPPGSPPRPSSVALPNDIGNSNGIMPTSPHIPRTDASLRPSFFRRTFGALLPTHYQPLPTQANVPGNGGGMMNDGVFANVMAKPARPVTVTGENGEVYMVPEETQAEAPPVCHRLPDAVSPSLISLAFSSPTRPHRQTQPPRTGRRQCMPRRRSILTGT